MSKKIVQSQDRQTAANDVFLRISEVLAIAGVSRSTWQEWVRKGDAPKPVRLGPSQHLVAWRSGDVRHWMDEQVARSSAAHYEPTARYPYGGAGRDPL